MDGGGLITLTDSPHPCKPQTKKTTTTTTTMDTFSVLVVDDDITCLAIVSAILKKFNYEVVAVKHPKDALCTLRINEGAFDLVVSDVHMPDMNGFELQQTIAQEFDVPVVLMSADDNESIALRGLESGAAFFIMKPINQDDLRDLWQFAAMKRKEKSFVNIEEISDEKTSSENIISASSSEHVMKTRESKKKLPRKEGSHDRIGESSQPKRPKIVWTNSLHNRFLEAIRSIGLDRAVPKKILEVMNVPGLTRENVASHLQKYRIFLRRVSDASYKIQYSSPNGFKSNFEACSPSTLMFNKFGRHTYPNLEASSSAQLPFRPSSLLSNLVNWQNSTIENLTLISHQNDPTRVMNMHNNYVARASINGHLANITLEDSLPSQEDVGSFDITTSSLPFKNPPYRTNYVGYNISDIKNITEKYKNAVSSRGITNLSGDQLQSSSAVVLNDNTLTQQVSIPSYFGADDNGGEYLNSIPIDPTDDFADYRMNFGLEGQYALSPIFDLPEFDVISAQQALESTLPNQNQSQQNIGGDNNISSNIYGDMINWDNCVNIPYSFDQAPNQLQSSQLTNSQGFPTSSQINGVMPLPTNEQYGLTNPVEFGSFSHQMNKTFVSPSHERNDDDFLESLLAPFGDSQPLEGSD